MKVKDVMTTEVVTVDPDASLRTAASVLAEHRISGCPVVDDAGRLLGVFSEADVLFKEQGDTGRTGWLARLADPLTTVDRRKLEAAFVREAMTAPAVTIGPERPVTAAARLMLGTGVNRLPVVDKDGRLVGIVTRADLVRAFVRSDSQIVHDIQQDVVRSGMWLDPARVRVEVADGEVTVAGMLETEADAKTLPKLIASVPGVVAVHSHLEAEA